jgi:tetratricopeptide (TPR) repeat protein
MEKVSLSQIGLYNPRRQNSELSERLFVIRQKQFQMLIEELNDEKDNSIPQHHIIIAQRGMGKTTLLNRIAIELHKPVYNDRFIPLAFPEEQYNITNLGDFWLNCLDALADSLESEQYDEKEIARIDEQVKELSMHKGLEKTAAKAYGVFMEFCRKIKRRPVLLIDNIGILFNKLGKNNQHSLRALLSEAGAPIILGAGVNAMPSQTNNKADALKPLTDYEMPFYDYFQIHYLKQLSFDEFLDLIRKLSDITQTNISIIYKERSRLQSLHYLTGGNPRTAIMLFKLIAKGFAVEINDDLEALLDEITPLYKARYEVLSEQAQKIIVEVALNDNMDAISLKQLSQKTGYANNQLSPQLKRLIEEGWLETTPAEKNKGNAYRMRERFFNIWLLMRESTRRKKQEITLLAKFMEWFYDDKLQEVAEKHSCRDFSTLNDGHYARALIENRKLVNSKTRKQLEDKLETLANKVDLSNDYLKDEIEKIKDKKIEKALKQENFEEAIRLLTEKINLSPNNAMSYFARGELYRNMQNSELAIADYTKSIELDNDEICTWLSCKGRSLMYFSQNQYELALLDYNYVIDNDKSAMLGINAASDYYFRGLIKCNLSDYSGAIEDLNKSIEIESDDAYYYNRRGWIKEYIEDYQGALDDFTKSIELDSNNASFYDYRGNLYKKMKQNNLAIEDISKAIKIDPNNAKWYYDRGRLYSDMQNPELAIADYTKSIELNSDEVYTWFSYKGRSLMYFLQNQYELAMLDYNYIIDSDKSTMFGGNAANDYAFRGSIKYRLLDYSEAIEDLKKAIEMEPNNAYYYNVRGWVQDEMENYQSALDDFNKSIEIESNNAILYYGRSFVKDDINDNVGAIEDLKIAIKLDPNFSLAYNSLGYLYLYNKLPQDKLAEEYFLKAIVCDKNNWAPKFNLVTLYRDKLSQFIEAKELFNEIKNQIEPEDRRFLQEVLFELHNRNEGIAKDYLLQALQVIEKALPKSTINSWSYFAAICLELKYGEWLLKILSDGGFDKILAPFYVAIQAMEIERQENAEQSDVYLNNRAVEIAEPAREIIKRIKKYQS